MQLGRNCCRDVDNFKTYSYNLLTLLFFYLSGSAVKCHICNSGENYDGKECDPLTTDRFLLDCADWATENNYPDANNFTMCRKQVQHGKQYCRILSICNNVVA